MLEEALLLLQGPHIHDFYNVYLSLETLKTYLQKSLLCR